ncbi:hypothetical protein [Nostoc sp.]
MPRTYCDPENPGDFVTEEDDGPTRESTQEEIEETVEQWQEWDKGEGDKND